MIGHPTIRTTNARFRNALRQMNWNEMQSKNGDDEKGAKKRNNSSLDFESERFAKSADFSPSVWGMTSFLLFFM